MARRWTTLMLLVLAVALVAGPASANDFTGYEEDERELACPYGQPIPKTQEPPGPGECDQPETETTYFGMVWDNDVKCNSGGQATPVGNIYVDGDAGTMWGGAGLCNDGTGALPVQGRVHAEGSMADQGFTVTADGDKDNSPAQAQGFAQIYAGLAGPSVRCGDDAGRQDASHIGPEDGQEDCGG